MFSIVSFSSAFSNSFFNSGSFFSFSFRDFNEDDIFVPNKTNPAQTTVAPTAPPTAPIVINLGASLATKVSPIFYTKHLYYHLRFVSQFLLYCSPLNYR